jgi:glycosyltransferase involved in cell wall biosynthesis
MRTRVADLGLDRDVLFAGVMTDVRPALGGLSALVLPSYEERCSRTLIEGMAMAIPIVATRVGGTPEVVEDGASGILVPPHDPARIGEAVSLLLGDATLRLRMGRQGRARAERRFDLAANLDRIAALYGGLRGGEGG